MTSLRRAHFDGSGIRASAGLSQEPDQQLLNRFEWRLKYRWRGQVSEQRGHNPTAGESFRRPRWCRLGASRLPDSEYTVSITAVAGSSATVTLVSLNQTTARFVIVTTNTARSLIEPPQDRELRQLSSSCALVQHRKGGRLSARHGCACECTSPPGVGAPTATKYRLHGRQSQSGSPARNRAKIPFWRVAGWSADPGSLSFRIGSGKYRTSSRTLLFPF
jgi:hypothetical protein